MLDEGELPEDEELQEFHELACDLLEGFADFVEEKQWRGAPLHKFSETRRDVEVAGRDDFREKVAAALESCLQLLWENLPRNDAHTEAWVSLSERVRDYKEGETPFEELIPPRSRTIKGWWDAAVNEAARPDPNGRSGPGRKTTPKKPVKPIADDLPCWGEFNEAALVALQPFEPTDLGGPWLAHVLQHPVGAADPLRAAPHLLSATQAFLNSLGEVKNDGTVRRKAVRKLLTDALRVELKAAYPDKKKDNLYQMTKRSRCEIFFAARFALVAGARAMPTVPCRDGEMFGGMTEEMEEEHWAPVGIAREVIAEFTQDLLQHIWMRSVDYFTGGAPRGEKHFVTHVCWFGREITALTASDPMAARTAISEALDKFEACERHLATARDRANRRDGVEWLTDVVGRLRTVQSQLETAALAGSTEELEQHLVELQEAACRCVIDGVHP